MDRTAHGGEKKERTRLMWTCVLTKNNPRGRGRGGDGAQRAPAWLRLRPAGAAVACGGHFASDVRGPWDLTFLKVRGQFV